MNDLVESTISYVSLFPQCLAKILAYDVKPINLDESSNIAQIWGLNRYGK